MDAISLLNFFRMTYFFYAFNRYSNQARPIFSNQKDDNEQKNLSDKITNNE